ncbi:hypothetical protein BDW22DRAFT_1424767 [Trametopsis cervina]|nr:hypothetical protein BDW22DRAFT_1424767 [Trametopsis cervina]
MGKAKYDLLETFPNGGYETVYIFPTNAFVTLRERFGDSEDARTLLGLTTDPNSVALALLYSEPTDGLKISNASPPPSTRTCTTSHCLSPSRGLSTIKRSTVVTNGVHGSPSSTPVRHVPYAKVEEETREIERRYADNCQEWRRFKVWLLRGGSKGKSSARKATEGATPDIQKILHPILGVLWSSLIWTVKPRNTGVLYALMALIGGLSLPTLPAALELVMELTRNADGSAAILWSMGNLVCRMFVLAEGLLRFGAGSTPPFNMHWAILSSKAHLRSPSQLPSCKASKPAENSISKCPLFLYTSGVK